MGRDEDHDRPKKSWREVDQQRNKSAHHGRKQEGGGMRPDRLQRSHAYRSYKSQLDKLFDGGVVPQTLKDKLAEADPDQVGGGARGRKQMAAAILAAKGPKELSTAIGAYRQAHGFPQDEEVLGKLLDASDEELVLEAIETLGKLHAESGLKRGASLRGRLKTVHMTLDDPDVQDAAKALLAKL